MSPRCAKSLAVAFALIIAGCSSSPTRDTPLSEPTKSEDSGRTKVEAAEATAPVEPAGPPPIPAEASQQFDNALTFLSAGDLARAESELKRLAERYPEYSGSLANLGILYAKSGKLPEAEQALKAALERSPDNAMALNQLGIVYRKLGRFKEAESAYNRAIGSDPNYALAHLNLGVLCDLYLQQPDRALAAFERYTALAQKPDPRVAAWMKELQGRVKAQRPPEATQ